ncbi:C-C motif chemokine 13 [Dissostichus eleginoides]|uniref:C-C motif chemokine 13 n=1 Tax=Dissostichus eleginoides TaxID=100907 RepID=A0AAD9B055_DISEL|nr:C-C motif chemokine 13 [Dissostichus eleginoides]
MAAPRLALCVCVLMLAVFTLTEGLRGAGPRRCCFKFNEREVASGRVISYVRTSQRCPNPAVKDSGSYLDTKAIPGETTNL